MCSPLPPSFTLTMPRARRPPPVCRHSAHWSAPPRIAYPPPALVCGLGGARPPPCIASPRAPCLLAPYTRTHLLPAAVVLAQHRQVRPHRPCAPCRARFSVPVGSWGCCLGMAHVPAAAAVALTRCMLAHALPRMTHALPHVVYTFPPLLW
ncbi:hypothetical protein B0H14DRAFT_3010073 [Mycena olivaceomarginata]|nr:hypothetical protein B0H14DRAFT_3010073 [Mycena olivaceomarginata]